MKQKIGIIGSGMVAKSLGTGLLKQGYELMLGTRDTSKLTEWQNADHNASARVGTFADTALFADIIILAVKGNIAQELLQGIPAEYLSGKTIIDATNPIAAAPPINGVLKFFTTQDQSLMEILQDSIPEAHFVKAFNSVGSALMVHPSFDSKPTMFICGNNDDAKKEVSVLLDELGWEAADFGKATSARAIEPLCMLWCIPGMLHNQWNHAFKLLKP